MIGRGETTEIVSASRSEAECRTCFLSCLAFAGYPAAEEALAVRLAWPKPIQTELCHEEPFCASISVALKAFLVCQRRFQQYDHFSFIRAISLYSSAMLPRSLTYRPSKNFRISLFRTLQICWRSAADCETFSRLLPVISIWSFTPFEASTVTPSCMVTLRTIFSPKKFLPNQNVSCLMFSQ